MRLGLVRELRTRGYTCEVIAPAKIARRPGERIKTDRRDALLLARAARAGELVAVTVPDARDEAMRDLSRAREDAVRARLKARQQLKALLLRHGHRYGGKSSWTLVHERYLARVTFAHPAQDIAYAEYRAAVKDAGERVERFPQALRGGACQDFCVCEPYDTCEEREKEDVWRSETRGRFRPRFWTGCWPGVTRRRCSSRAA